MENAIPAGSGYYSPEMQIDRMIVPNIEAPSYNSYLKINELLSLQTILTKPEEHDETLFIIVHQSYELWFKQILHELKLAEKQISSLEFWPLIKTFSRINVIFDVLIHQIDILETMSPDDFAKFRKNLSPASGFQSHQFRLLEFKLGMKRPQFIKFFDSDPHISKMLEQAILEPSFYDLFLQMMEKKGFDKTKKLEELAGIYKSPEKNYEIYNICEKMIEMDAKILRWRFRHVNMVERMIGSLPGTGGSSGAQYLSSTLKFRFFQDLWDVRNMIS